MKRVGSVKQMAQNLLLLRTDQERIAIGSELIDADLTTVGTVVDVFGPVEQPYLAVSPSETVHPPSLLGEPLYAQ
jgi:RNA-binding protein